MKKNANKGFSLVELIIVIAIMAVLIGVLAPQFIKQVEKSRESTDLQNIEEIKTTVEVWTADQEASKTVKISWNKDALTIEGVTGDDLADYGLSTLPSKLKSKEWGACEWEYADYKWTLKTNGAAKYYNADGSAVKKSGS